MNTLSKGISDRQGKSRPITYNLSPNTCDLLPNTYNLSPNTCDLLPITYFGPISWYRKLVRMGIDAIDRNEHYVKQTTRNHCLIATANGIQKLTVPVTITQHPSPITQVRLSDHGKWRTEHWNALCTAYGESPFFERRDWEYLFDYDLAITQKVIELLNIPTIKQLNCSTIPYWQVYQQRHGFLPDLSILDLLCCMGNEAILYL